MEQLATTINYRGFTYKQIKRGDHAFMYAQYSGKHLVGHEVFRRKVQQEKETVIAGQNVTYANKEMFPSNESFGEWAWAIRSENAAIQKFEYLERNPPKESN